MEGVKGIITNDFLIIDFLTLNIKAFFYGANGIFLINIYFFVILFNFHVGSWISAYLFRQRVNMVCDNILMRMWTILSFKINIWMCNKLFTLSTWITWYYELKTVKGGENDKKQTNKADISTCIHLNMHRNSISSNCRWKHHHICCKWYSGSRNPRNPTGC